MGSGRVRRLLTGATGSALALGMIATIASVGLAAAGGARSGPPRIAAPDAAAGRVLAAARRHVGEAYLYGGAGPASWDCSGLTSVMWRTAGGVAGIPRTAHEQQAWATPVTAAAALPGDLVFFGRPATHVGIYQGRGWIIDASSSHRAIVERPLWTSAVTYGRVPRRGAAASAPAPAPAPPPPSPPSPPASHAPAPWTGRVPPTGGPLARGLVAAARAAVGARYTVGGTGPAYDDGALIAVLWHRVSGRQVPAGRTALARATVAIPRSLLRRGDVLIYGGADVWHVGIYVGDGRMVDASRSSGRVVLRPVLPSSQLRYGRLRRH
ncbi:MAG: NlpC/P60 family protein [Frankiaceae bacterium]